MSIIKGERMRTEAIVHESLIDTLAKRHDLAYQLVLRLERRTGRWRGFVAGGPVPIRDRWRRAGDGQMFVLYVAEMVND